MSGLGKTQFCHPMQGDQLSAQAAYRVVHPSLSRAHYRQQQAYLGYPQQRQHFEGQIHHPVEFCY